MSSINGISGGGASGDAWAQLRAARAATQSRIQNQLLAKVDADGSGGVDSSELQTALDTIAKKTGVAVDTKATDLLAKADQNGDGSLGAAELEKALQSALPPPSTMDFAQSRSADNTAAMAAKSQAADDLFAKVDADGNGSIDKTELNALMQAMAQDEPATRSTTSSPGANSANDDRFDTNKDGVVSALELAAGTASGAAPTDPLAALFEAVDTDGDEKLSVSETDALAKQAATALETLQKASSMTGNSDGNGGTAEDKPFDLRTLAQLVLKQYEAIASQGSSASTSASTLNATA
ncbi:hypothetical protein RD110_19225 [Rhodoferax koreense]|uniref:EF-hand domain-containing protein n=1 Tax=Rhodoferax koreensis TaxID=1842727 RepID=A0A1P8JZ96_9BURK|nr:EF-hand domain-containing protein [Rhodoferax koreense]APW39077.1 hypothetical protein RD110_19225 [Rhodoferax koreense]